MKSNLLMISLALLFATACTTTNTAVQLASLAAQVEATERAFAKTMADRDHPAFVSYLSADTVFLAGTSTQQGRQMVADQWAPYFDGPDAPFSWQPETVAVLDSGDLAISTGPVWDAQGTRVSTYTSIWRQEQPGVWRIIFDRGNKYCEQN